MWETDLHMSTKLQGSGSHNLTLNDPAHLIALGEDKVDMCMAVRSPDSSFVKVLIGVLSCNCPLMIKGNLQTLL